MVSANVGLAAVVGVAKVVAVFGGLVLVRITVPRFKLETLTKLGWLSTWAVLALALAAYAAGGLLAFHVPVRSWGDGFGGCGRHGLPPVGAG